MFLRYKKYKISQINLRTIVQIYKEMLKSTQPLNLIT